MNSIDQTPGKPVTNFLSIDVEDYFMVSAFADSIKFEDWGAFESRIERNTRRILELLGAQGVTATFFVLGWVGKQFPGVVREIHAAGHEIACHGYNHRLVYDQTPLEFREDIRKAKRILEDITGTGVAGYRAASFSVIKETLWALEVLIEEGFTYDSSIFPVHHDRYGMPEAGRFPHRITTGSGPITEFPPSTYKLFSQNIPIGGGGYLRLFPLALTMRAITAINEQEKEPAVLYLHPWEIDADQPRMNGRLLSKLRHYINLRSTMPKLITLLNEFDFQELSASHLHHGFPSASGFARAGVDRETI
ncbi:MAG TPA: XrtA system polysaccharide deacetylase [Nitrospirota bacterium]|nr:XrtA system polysaccharide deacetylase [Nitrospirota bacterium]